MIPALREPTLEEPTRSKSWRYGYVTLFFARSSAAHYVIYPRDHGRRWELRDSHGEIIGTYPTCDEAENAAKDAERIRRSEQ